MRRRRIRVEEGSGNLFRDLGFPNARREQVKAQLTLQIYRLIKRRRLTQAAAAKILGIKQPHVSALMRGRSGTFSVERLRRFLTALGPRRIPKFKDDREAAAFWDRHPSTSYLADLREVTVRISPALRARVVARRRRMKGTD